MLPSVKINFANGALGSVAPSADCVAGLLATAVAVADTFVLGNAYLISKVADLNTLGITQNNNACLYKHVKEFYTEAGEGAELWIMGVPDTVKPSEMLDKDNTLIPYAKNLIQIANGRLRFIAIAYQPASGYQTTVTDGLDTDVWDAALNAQVLAEWATQNLYAPIFTIIAARGFNHNNITDLKDLTTCSYNRVAILIGDTVSHSEGAAVGLLMGRIAACPVQRHIGRVKDGPLNILNAYLGDKDPSVANGELIHDKGYISLRTFTGKSGYFFTDDCLATDVADDYRSIARRRTIDKAFRIIYATMLENVNDEIPITDEGYLLPSMVKAWESEIISAIATQMTANAELGTDPADADDTGVKVYINPKQQVAATNKINITVQVKPYGYAKYIDVELGFVTITNSEN